MAGPAGSIAGRAPPIRPPPPRAQWSRERMKASARLAEVRIGCNPGVYSVRAAPIPPLPVLLTVLSLTSLLGPPFTLHRVFSGWDRPAELRASWLPKGPAVLRLRLPVVA